MSYLRSPKLETQLAVVSLESEIVSVNRLVYEIEMCECSVEGPQHSHPEFEVACLYLTSSSLKSCSSRYQNYAVKKGNGL